jgi:hypothetical protein
MSERGAYAGTSKNSCRRIVPIDADRTERENKSVLPLRVIYLLFFETPVQKNNTTDGNSRRECRRVKIDVFRISR